MYDPFAPLPMAFRDSSVAIGVLYSGTPSNLGEVVFASLLVLAGVGLLLVG